MRIRSASLETGLERDARRLLRQAGTEPRRRRPGPGLRRSEPHRPAAWARRGYLPRFTTPVGAAVEIFHRDVDKPLRREMGVISPGVTDSGRGFAGRRGEHAEVAATAHFDFGDAPLHDATVRIFECRRVLRGQISPADRATFHLHDFAHGWNLRSKGQSTPCHLT